MWLGRVHMGKHMCHAFVHAGTGNTDDGDGQNEDETSADLAAMGKDNEQGADSSDAGGASGGAYDSCRPLAPYTGDSPAPAASAPQPTILFGNEHMYIFFRCAYAGSCCHEEGDACLWGWGLAWLHRLRQSGFVTKRLQVIRP